MSESNSTVDSPQYESLTNNEEKPDACLVCFGHENDENGRFIDLDQNRNYGKKCECKLHIHEYCFERWYYTDKSCPICRVEIKHQSLSNRCQQCIHKGINFCAQMIVVYIVLALIYLVGRNIFISA